MLYLPMTKLLLTFSSTKYSWSIEFFLHFCDNFINLVSIITRFFLNSHIFTKWKKTLCWCFDNNCLENPSSVVKKNIICENRYQPHNLVTPSSLDNYSAISLIWNWPISDQFRARFVLCIMMAVFSNLIGQEPLGKKVSIVGTINQQIRKLY